jgi:hypothetical protein
LTTVSYGQEGASNGPQQIKLALAQLTPNQFPVTVIPGVSGNPAYQALNPNQSPKAGFSLSFRTNFSTLIRRTISQPSSSWVLFMVQVLPGPPPRGGRSWRERPATPETSTWEWLQLGSGPTLRLGYCRLMSWVRRSVRRSAISERMTRLALTLIGGACLSLGGCAALWEHKLAFAAPSSDAVLEIQQPFPANGWGLRVELRTGTVTKVIYEIRGDVFLDFADAKWSSDGGTVALFTCGTPPVRLAYDLKRGSQIPFAASRQAIRTDLQWRYHLDATRDAFEWACSSEGKAAFLNAYPQAAPR